MISLVVAVAVSAVLVAVGSAVAMKLRGVPVRYVDVAIMAALCSALAPLPAAGWALGTIVLYLLATRAMRIDVWPDTVILVAIANAVWALALGTL